MNETKLQLLGRLRDLIEQIENGPDIKSGVFTVKRGAWRAPDGNFIPSGEVEVHISWWVKGGRTQ